MDINRHQIIILIIALVLAGTAFAREPEFRAQHWITGGIMGAIPGGRNPIVSCKLSRQPDVATNVEAVGGFFRINLFNINLTASHPSDYSTWRPGDEIQVYIDPALNGGYRSRATITYTTSSPGSPGYEDVGNLTVEDSVLAYGGPQLTVKVLLEGYYNPAAGTQPPAMISVEARTGGDDPSSATSVVETTYIRLDGSGEGTNGFPSGTIPFNNYYFVIRHIPAAGQKAAMHLPIITGARRPFGKEPAIDHNLTIDVSNTTSVEYLAAYTPTDAVPAMYPTGSVRLMRVGDINGDGFIGTNDFAIWKSVYNAYGYSAETDLTGDGFTITQDFAFWKGEYNELPVGSSHNYVP